MWAVRLHVFTVVFVSQCLFSISCLDFFNHIFHSEINEIIKPPVLRLSRSSSACKSANIDLVLLIDGSKSVRPQNFELVKKFVNQVGSIF